MQRILIDIVVKVTVHSAFMTPAAIPFIATAFGSGGGSNQQMVCVGV
jgi:di/tricarboxylate transporter